MEGAPPALTVLGTPDPAQFSEHMLSNNAGYTVECGKLVEMFGIFMYSCAVHGRI